MGELSYDNILGEEDIENLFSVPDDSSDDNSEGEVEEDVKNEVEKEKETKTTEDIDPDSLFGEDEPESVGSGKDKEAKGKEDAIHDEGDGTSPNNFYSSIANALAVDGIFQNLADDVIKKADSAEALSDLIDAEVLARLDERQQRISQALDNGVEPSDIKRYEGALNYVSSISDADLAEESDRGEQLRKGLIYQDFLNKGYSPDKARKMTERTVDAGTDIEDAKEALQSNREFFQGEYNKLLKEAQREADAAKAERERQADRLRESLLKDKQLLGDLEISNDLRRKAYDNVMKPVWRDPETGEHLTAIQKYDREHRGEFLKYVGMIFTLTNGFKDFESFTKGKVKKEVRKGLRDLERTLNTTSRNSDGSLKLVSSVSDDPESFFKKGMKLDF